MAVLPLFILPLAHVFTDERLTVRKRTGVVLGFVGAAVLIGPAVFDFTEGSLALPQLACVGVSMSYAISSVITRACPKVDSMSMAAVTLVVGTCCLISVMLVIRCAPVETGNWRLRDHLPRPCAHGLCGPVAGYDNPP